MKKSLGWFLIFIFIAFAGNSFAATQTYSDDFDDSSKYGNWFVSYGSWSHQEYPAGSGNNIYWGIPETDGVASSYMAAPGFTGLTTTGLHMEAILGLPEVYGRSTGVFFGASPTDHHSIFLAYDSDGSGNIWLGLNRNVKTTPDAEYWHLLGSGFSADAVFWLDFDVDETNNIDGRISYRNGTTGDFTAIEWGDDVLPESLPVLTGVTGVFSYAENGFDYFEVSYDDGNPVPIPTTATLLIFGLLGLVNLNRKRR